MAIITIHYQRVKSLGNYENERIGAWVNVEEGQTTDDALRQAKAFVEARLGLSDEADEAQKRISRLEYEHLSLGRQVRQLEERLSSAKQVWQLAKRILAAHGIDIGADPFPPEAIAPEQVAAVGAPYPSSSYDDERDDGEED